MNENELRAKLIAAARKNPPSQEVPCGFERRILSHLSARPAPNVWALWCRPLWRAAISCAAITVLCALWAFGSGWNSDASDNFSGDLEAAVFAPMSQHIEEAW